MIDSEAMFRLGMTPLFCQALQCPSQHEQVTACGVCESDEKQESIQDIRDRSAGRCFPSSRGPLGNDEIPNGRQRHSKLQASSAAATTRLSASETTCGRTWKCHIVSQSSPMLSSRQSWRETREETSTSSRLCVLRLHRRSPVGSRSIMRIARRPQRRSLTGNETSHGHGINGKASCVQFFDAVPNINQLVLD